MNDVLIDSVSYPALKLEVGKSWAFPDDCDLSLRGDFANGPPAAQSWFPGFFGPPSAPSDDVHGSARGHPLHRPKSRRGGRLRPSIACAPTM